MCIIQKFVLWKYKDKKWDLEDRVNMKNNEFLNVIKLNELDLPLIVHVIKNNLFHYMVIQKVSKEYIVYYDPIGKTKKVSIGEFFQIWTGYVVNIKCNSEISLPKYENTNKFRLCSFLQNEKKRIVGTFCMSLLIAGLSIIDALFYQRIVDYVISNTIFTVGTIGLSLNIVFIILILFVLLQSIIILTKNIILSKIEFNIGNQLNELYFTNIFQLPYVFFKNWSTGALMSRFQDMEKVKKFFSESVLTIIFDFFLMSIGGIALYCIEKRLFFIVLLSVISYMIVMAMFRKEIENRNQLLMEQNALLTMDMKDYIDGIENIKTFSIEEKVCQELTQTSGKMNYFARRITMLSSVESTIMNIISGVSSSVVFWMGCIFVQKGILTVGTLIAFQSLMGYFVTPILDLVQIQSAFQTAKLAQERLEDLYEAKKEIDIFQKTDNMNLLSGDIIFENVFFRYGFQEPVLKGISFVIHQGQHVILKGASGSGKTTIVNILKGFLTVTSGNVYIGGKDIKNIPISELRRQVAYISQTPYFFGKTLRENLVLETPHVSDQELNEILKGCQLLEMVKGLPLGLDTILSENAKNLSGGQRQRLSIARALITHPRIIIIDEGMNQIDSLNERRIMDFISKFLVKCTIIRILHGEFNEKNVDQILEIKEGKIRSGK